MFASNSSQVSSDVNYIEDVFSTYLYGTSATTIPNGIDIAGKGALIWLKSRANDAGNMNNALFDSARGFSNILYSNTTGAQIGPSGVIASTSSNGFTLGGFNDGSSYVSWTFRKQPKFFDEVTFTSDGTTNQAISHSLGSAPGCIFIKRTDASQSWIVWHRGNGTTNYYTWSLNNTAAAASTSDLTAYMTSTSFQPNRLDDYLGNKPVNGGTYVAYLFAHNAGGFGLTGTDNVISCGSWTGTGSAQDINLGYEPQFLIIKNATTGSTNWVMLDNMRGLPVGTGDAYLKPNLSDAEVTTSDFVDPTATGFRTILSTMNTSGNTFIYIAIRRGPMKVPTDGTTVFSPISTSSATGTAQTTSFPVDMQIQAFQGSTGAKAVVDRLRGVSTTSTEVGSTLYTNLTNAESSATGGSSNKWGSTGFSVPSDRGGISSIYWNMRRAPSFFDEVCYTGTGNATTFSHNLGVAPELMIVKGRSGATGWIVYTSPTGATKYMRIDNTNAAATLTAVWNDTSPTSSVFTVGTNSSVNTASATYVAYLFATCAGVSKVGLYTGNGSTQTINCGFTGGARFVLIKRTDSTGDWYVYDTARGMTTLVDPYLLLNSTAAESATLGSVTTVTTGFAVNASILAAINTNGASYIYLSIA